MTTLSSGRRYAAVLLAALAAAIFFSAPALAKQPRFVPIDPIMPLSQIKPGMTGEARTVIRGTEIVKIPIRVLDVVPQMGLPKNLILIQADGSAIQSMGGIAAGMSGSPVYIGGKLIGGIGYGFKFTKQRVGFVTPIEEMIDILDNTDRIPSFKPAPIVPSEPLPETKSPDLKPPVSEDKKLKPKSEDQDGEEEPGESAGDDPGSGARELPNVLFEGSHRPDDEPDAGASADIPADDIDGNLVPFAAPLRVGGVSERMAAAIGASLGRDVTPLGSSKAGRSEVKLKSSPKPGAAISGMLVWGDVEVGALGTLTAVGRDGRFLAFAHPFVSLGATAMPLAEASVNYVVPSLESSFKIGTTGSIIGTITQDRPQGVGGTIGMLTPAASCTIKFNDTDNNVKTVKRFQMIYNPVVMTKLAASAITGCIEDVWGRKGDGTARVTATFGGGALPAGWSRTNMFHSESDVAAEMLKEFNLLSKMFATNQFQEIRPFGMEIDVEMTQDPRILYIEKIDVEKKTYRPGDTVTVAVTLRPWRKQPFVRKYDLVIPKKFTGVCELLVRGGGIDEGSQESLAQGWRTITSLNALLGELDAQETNDQIVVELRGQEPLFQKGKNGKIQPPSVDDIMDDRLLSDIKKEKLKEKSMRVIRSNYYVEGLLRKLIQLESPKGGKSARDEAIEALEADSPDEM